MKVLYWLAGVADKAWARVKANPVVASYVVTAVVGVAARYGLHLDPELVAVILGLTATGAAITARSKVTPV